ncbi:hypothetical protein [Thermomonas aquatica]|uniref:Uncharacterized protein n=1 Tax=Thermomonas aquatica TaxID=2202149 RepID=A0A5B7ZMK5_9GAMM|nr:hypothetical protein [Thermomonas aquatica]QDA56524.1 hypothetical protein FHQ07_03940 [Thermomonas aquatica]
MNPVVLGLVGGTAFGIIAVLLMLPLSFPDKRTALIAAFCSRFSIGLLIPVCNLPLPPVAAGVVVGALISLSDAVVTKAYVPIMVTGALGGGILGWVAGRFAA